MHEAAEALAESLLYEGYALYPYTPGAPKNSTPTPFGIAYPTGYARLQPAAFDHVGIEVVALPESDATEIEAAALFLQATGPGHRAEARRVPAGPVPIADLLTAPVEVQFASEAAAIEGGEEIVSGAVRLSAAAAGEGMFRVGVRVHNTTRVTDERATGMERGEALRRSLLSCHAMLGISAGRFASPLEDRGSLGEAVRACENVNAWPVLASPDDDAVLGASYLLPDHPRISPQSKVNYFDNTEIEEALVLHVQALTDEERASIDGQDAAVREMVERAEGTSQEDILELHGVMRESDPDIRFPEWSEPGGPQAVDVESASPVRQPPPGPADTAGEDELEVGGKAFRRGGKVVLRPGRDGDPYDAMMDGRTATIERIYLDYDGRAYFGVSIDDDPMREVLRDTGRYLFFFADELDPA